MGLAWNSCSQSYKILTYNFKIIYFHSRVVTTIPQTHLTSWLWRGNFLTHWSLGHFDLLTPLVALAYFSIKEADWHESGLLSNMGVCLITVVYNLCIMNVFPEKGLVIKTMGFLYRVISEKNSWSIQKVYKKITKKLVSVGINLWSSHCKRKNCFVFSGWKWNGYKFAWK